jgi:hypothetical protein
MDDLTPLKKTEHMLRWLADEPFSAIRSSIEGILKEQVADSHLVESRITSEPQWLTGARPHNADRTKSILVRTGVAFEFALTVESHAGSEQLQGVFTWVAVNLDQPGRRMQRQWMDIGGTLSAFGSGGELKARVYLERLGLEGYSGPSLRS